MRFRAFERAPPTSTLVEAADAAPPPPPASPPIADAGAPPREPVVAAPPIATAAGRATPESPVYLNEATVDDLRRLPGVGAKRAEAILAHRRHVGRFTRVEDLLRVKGVGRATIKKWRPLVRFEVRDLRDAGSS